MQTSSEELDTSAEHQSSTITYLQSDDAFEEVIEENPVVTKHLKYDPEALYILEDIKRAPLQENDSVILIGGRPGVGKTKLAIDLACYVDPTFNIDRIVFDHKELIEKALKCTPGQAIIWDEAREGTESKQAMSQKNQRVGLFLDTVRSRCLFIFLIQPSFWNFQQELVMERSDLFLHVYKQHNNEYNRNDSASLPFVRGFYDAYSKEQMTKLYIKGKRFRNYRCGVKPSNEGLRFGSRWGVDKQEYQKRKDVAVAAMNTAAEKNVEIDREALRMPAAKLRNSIIASLKAGIPGLTFKNACTLMGQSPAVMKASMDWDTRKLFEFDR